jgi:hypothetical protein
MNRPSSFYSCCSSILAGAAVLILLGACVNSSSGDGEPQSTATLVALDVFEVPPLPDGSFLSARCLKEPLPVDAMGQAQVRLIIADLSARETVLEADAEEACRRCDLPGRRPLEGSLEVRLRGMLASGASSQGQTGGDFACLCELVPAQDEGLRRCQEQPGDPSAPGERGWCYVDPDNPALAPYRQQALERVALCPEDKKRAIYFEGGLVALLDNRPSHVFIYSM